jgi:hypothetical protein
MAPIVSFSMQAIAMNQGMFMYRLETLIEQNRSKFVETWDDYFGH